jgi:predicted permease
MLGPVKTAVRSLLRRPAVAVVAVVSLAVGIGVNTAVFSIVDALFLRPPAIQNPENLVYVIGHFKDSGDAIFDWSDYKEITAQTSAFSGVTAYMRRGGEWRNGDEMTMLLVHCIADNYFDLLGVKPALGRIPEPGRDYSGDSEPPLILTNWFWRERMGGRADIIGQPMQFRDHVFRVAAVLPPGFQGVDSMGFAHVWIPAGSWARFWKSDLERGGGQFEVLGRLRHGATIEQAQAQLDLVARRIEANDSRVPKGRGFVARSIGRQFRERLLPGVLIMAVVALVLLVACANVAAVLLAHAEARRREIGVRLALGAGHFALLRQFLTESAVLACVGAVAGLLLGSWLITLAPVLAPPSDVPIKFDFRVDGRLLLFTGAAVLLTLVIFGLAPLIYSMRVSLLEALAGSRSVGRSSRSIARFGFVAAQVALSVVLVAGAVVLMRALADARDIYPGYDTSRPLALVFASLDGSGGKRPETVVYNEAVSRMMAIGGVETVTYARHLPLVDSGSGAYISVIPQGAPADATPPRVYFNLVGPRFFETLGVRMTSGRPFADSDHHGGAPVAIVNAEAARRFWPGQDARGKTLRIRDQQYEVVGVAANGRIASLYETPAPAIFLPASRIEWGETILIARTKVDPAAVLKEVAKTAGRTTGLRVYMSMTLRTLMKDALYRDWVPTVLGCALAVIGLLLAAGGLYGAISYATQRRMSEFGVRIAVGARAGQIGSLVLKQAAWICCTGIPAGVVLFAATFRYYGATLLRNRPLDTISLVVATAVTIAVVLLGAIVPAVRAAKLDPVQVLRSE